MRFWISMLLIITGCATSAADYNLGIRRLSTEVAGVEVPIRLYYPTAEKATQTEFGPWTLIAAKNSNPAIGVFPLIVISHGLGGNDWNHHLLAQRFVAKGFVVAAVRHPDDLKRVGSQALLHLRPLELQAAIDRVLDGELGKLIDRESIGAFGFSQGGLTVLRALGAQADHQKLVEHCQKHKIADEEFCTGKSASVWQKLGLLWGKLTYSAPYFDPTQPVDDKRLKAAVVAAPVGAPVTDLLPVRTPIWIIRPGADHVLKFPFHAEAIHKALDTPHEYTVYQGVEHYAFLSPFPQSIKAEVGLPANDPHGFDRGAFLEEINSKIVDFFHENLTSN